MNSAFASQTDCGGSFAKLLPSIQDPIYWNAAEYRERSGQTYRYKFFDEVVSQKATLVDDVADDTLAALARKIWNTGFKRKFTRRDAGYEMELRKKYHEKFAKNPSDPELVPLYQEYYQREMIRRSQMNHFQAPAVEVRAVRITFVDGIKKTLISTSSRSHYAEVPADLIKRLLLSSAAKVRRVEDLHIHPATNAPLGVGDAAMGKQWKDGLKTINPNIEFSMHVVSESQDHKLVLFTLDE